MIIAVDHGNAAIKTKSFTFPAGLTRHSSAPPLAEDIIELDGAIWTLSGRRIPYMRDKSKDERFFILTLFAIAKELTAAELDEPVYRITVASGLPPEHYGALKERFTSYLSKGELQFLYNGREFSISIENVFVYPQAYSAVVPLAGKLLKYPRTFIVDIGGYTTDVLLLRNGKPDLTFCRSLETGIITVTNAIAGRINSQYDLTIDDDHVEDVLMGRNTVLKEEVCRAIRTEVAAHAGSILDRLRELQVDLRSNPAVFTGGGAQMLKPFLDADPMVSEAEYITEQNANAVGYELLAAAQLRRER